MFSSHSVNKILKTVEHLLPAIVADLRDLLAQVISLYASLTIKIHL